MIVTRPVFIRAIAFWLTLMLLYVAIALIADGGTARNERHENLLRLGSLTLQRSPEITSENGSLVVSPRARSISSATWDAYSYEVSHLLHEARTCKADIVIPDTALTSESAAGLAEVLFNGRVVRRFTFAPGNSGLFYVSPGRFVPSNDTPRVVDIVALDRRFGFVIPLPANSCRAKTYDVGIRARHVSWTIPSIGLALRYTPAATPLFHNRALTELTALALAALLFASLFMVLLVFSSVGWGPLIAATGILTLAPLTNDQWDFPLWIRFSEMATFGGANPAHLWDASPLWAFIPPLFSTITLGSYLATGDGSRTLTEFLLKIALGIAYCCNAYAVAIVAPRRLRRFFIASVLLIPAGLYEIAAGYREPFAVALALAGLTLASRRKLAIATIVICAAASISETLLALVLFPAALALSESGSPLQRAGRSGALAILGIGLFAAEWQFLIPRSTASFAFSYRFGEAALGGASWAGALDGLHLLPAWLPAGSAFFGAVVFIAAATFPALRLARVVRDASLSEKSKFTGSLAAFVGFVAAFFLAFRGVDPNTWYALIVISFYYFALSDPTNPFPLLFGSIIGFAFYAVLGFGDFVNHAVFWPFDRGLLGVLGVSRYVFDLMQCGLALCLIVALSCANTKLLFSLKSPWLFMFFAAAVATTAIRFYVLDFIISVAGVAAISLTLRIQIASQRPHLVRAAQAFFRSRDPKAIATARAMLLRRTFHVGLCDIVLITGTMGVCFVQTGTGVTTIIGWFALALIAVWAVSGKLMKVVLRRS